MNFCRVCSFCSCYQRLCAAVHSKYAQKIKIVDENVYDKYSTRLTKYSTLFT